MNTPTTVIDRLGIRQDWAQGKPAARILEAAGHPGYGNKFAREVLARMEADPTLTPHEAVYGRRF